ncbi:MAG: 3'(2'),5'-bisphosphate nucleotidase CysQ [Proteobacteria bacterium]|nr:3'(2'),5'-bisphosphate nucleotidase CysQ [Pseudomonadota bacterium]
MPIDSHNCEALLAATETLAVEAGAAIMAIYETDFAVAEKSDHSPVTEADETAERLIVSGLEKLTPTIAIVAEEKMAGGDFPNIDAGEFWLVDPLDGTREFISRNGEFTVNIALVRDGVPIMGVVYLPASAQLYAGAASLGAFVIEKNQPRHPIQACVPSDEGLLVVASRSHMNDETRALIADLNVAGFKSAGSSLKFCLVAAGEADYYPRLGRTMEWDTAAGHAILVAAGGSVTTLDGAPLRYGKPGFENPHFTARGRMR